MSAVLHYRNSLDAFLHLNQILGPNAIDTVWYDLLVKLERALDQNLPVFDQTRLGQPSRHPSYIFECVVNLRSGPPLAGMELSSATEQA